MNARPNLIRLPIWLAAVFASSIVLVRLAPYFLEFFTGFKADPASTYPWNFMPVMAICLFGGARFANRLQAWLIPLSAYLIGDIGLWALKGVDYAFGMHTPVVYGGFAIAIGLGFLLRKTRTSASFVAGGLGLGILGETIFFLVSNGAVWLFMGYYTFDPAGLLTCLGMGAPFYLRGLASTLLYGTVLFGGYALLDARQPQVNLAPAAAD